MRTRLMALALLVSAVLASVIVAANAPISYIYKRADRGYIRISNQFYDGLGKLSKKYGDEFVWLRMNGRNYLIRDAKTLGEVREAFRHVDALDPSMQAVERRLKPFEKEIETIEERIDTFSDSLDDERLSEAKREAFEEKMREAEEAMRAVEVKMRVVEREMERLEKEIEKRQAVAEERFQKILVRAVDQGIAERVE